MADKNVGLTGETKEVLNEALEEYCRFIITRFVLHFNYVCTFHMISRPYVTSIKYKVESDKRYLPYIELSLALQPLSAGNSAEFSQASNSNTIQPREINLTSLYSLSSCESISVYFKPKNR